MKTPTTGQRHPAKKDFPEGKPPIRTYSVLPARAIQDDHMHHTTLRVLGVICIYTNGAGVAWPSLFTIARHVDRRKETVSRHIQKLIKTGYLRKLHRKDYPSHIRAKSRGRTNRYQVLFNGNDPVPTREQIESPHASIIADQGEPIDTSAGDNTKTGVQGDAGRSGGTSTQASVLANAFKKAVESVTGQPRVAQQSVEAGRSLAGKGVTPGQVTEHTVAMCKEGMRSGKAAPQNLGQVARWAGL